MTPAEAKQVIEVLAVGTDPETGEVLPDAHPLNNPHVIRALFLAAKGLELLAGQQRPPAADDASRAAKAGKAWTADEDRQLVDGFDSGTAVAALAHTHQRSPGAITSRLARLGRLQVNRNTTG